jgi:salicylate hydroxylase
MLVMPCRESFQFDPSAQLLSNNYSPHLSQGVAQAVEDVIAITAVLSAIQSKEQLSAALNAYETSRRSRVMEVQSATAQARKYTYRKDGDVQEAREKNQGGTSEAKGSEEVLKMMRSSWNWDPAQAARTALSDILKSA